jgi:hypothetical protein
MPANALVWVEKGGTETEPVPMISGFAQPVATSIRIGGQQGCGRQGRCGDKELGKPTHISTPY